MSVLHNSVDARAHHEFQVSVQGLQSSLEEPGCHQGNQLPVKTQHLLPSNSAFKNKNVVNVNFKVSRTEQTLGSKQQ